MITNKEYLKKTFANPFNWTGSKHRYLKDLFEVLPNEKEGIKVLDPFVGGGDLISKLPASWKVTASDTMSQIVELHNACKNKSFTKESILENYNLRRMSKTNQDAYLELREEYNKNPCPELLYLLMTNSFNNQLRFNSRGSFNMPFGKDRSSFNKNMQTKLENYQNLLENRDITFSKASWEDYDFSEFDLILLDPPYSNTCATYNESTGWSEEDDKKLFEELDRSGVDFIYFNQTYSKGVENNTLLDWLGSQNYKVLKETSTGCSYNRDNSFTQEVMAWKIEG